MKRVIVFLSSLSLLILIQTAQAKTVEDRLQEMEQKLTALQRTYMTNNQEVASALARSQAIQQDFSSVKGEAEASKHLLRSQHEETMKIISELDHRIQAIEERLTIFGSQLSKALGKVAPEAAAEADLYQKGLDLMSSSQYLEAAAAFETFVRKYNRSQFSPAARFWIGECFYSMRDYQRAVKEFQNFIEQYPRDDKVPEALLKQGNSFYELGMLDEARAFYEKVISSHPSSAAATQATTKITRIEGRKTQGSEAAAGEQFGSYPTETLEQKRRRLSGGQESSEDVTPIGEKPAKKAPPPGPPQKDF